MHVRWAPYFEKFTFVIKHKSDVLNKVANALSRRAGMLVILRREIIGFECLKELYRQDANFAEIWEKCLNDQPVGVFLVTGGYLLKGNQLCITMISVRKNIVRDLHGERA